MKLTEAQVEMMRNNWDNVGENDAPASSREADELFEVMLEKGKDKLDEDQIEMLRMNWSNVGENDSPYSSKEADELFEMLIELAGGDGLYYYEYKEPYYAIVKAHGEHDSSDVYAEEVYEYYMYDVRLGWVAEVTEEYVKKKVKKHGKEIDLDGMGRGVVISEEV